MQFVWVHYPQYSLCPHTILDWLIGEARRIANEEWQAKQLEQNAYGQGPTRYGNNNYNAGEEEEDYENEDTQFGVPKK